jgi:hypothetical protein
LVLTKSILPDTKKAKAYSTTDALTKRKNKSHFVNEVNVPKPSTEDLLHNKKSTYFASGCFTSNKIDKKTGDMDTFFIFPKCGNDKEFGFFITNYQDIRQSSDL